MRHPVEIFDSDGLHLMGEALQAAIATVRLTGNEPSPEAQTGMARRLIGAAGDGHVTRLSLTEAAPTGSWN